MIRIFALGAKKKPGWVASTQAVSVLSAFYDLFVGTSSFSAGLIANTFGYAAAFIMAIAALGAAAIAGRFVFATKAAPTGVPALVNFDR